MRKISLATALVLATSLLLPAHVSAATPVAGAACSKAGLTSSTSTKKFTCIKSGKKLVWDKGTTIVKPAVAQSPKPTPTPTVTPPVSTPPEVGSPCIEIGAFFDTPNTRYVCNQESGKNVWRVWSPNPTPTQSSTPTPTPTPTKAPFKALIPLTLPVAPMGPITFANAASMASSIPAQAWQNIQKEIAAHAPVTVPITIDIGPNTKTTAEQMIPSINREYQLLNGFAVPPTYHGVVFSAFDEKWGEEQAVKVARDLGWTPSNAVPVDGILFNVRNQCGFNNGVAEDCYGGNALGGLLAKDGFSTYGVQSGGGFDAWTIQNQYAGPMTQVTHELTHNMQFAQFTGVAMKPGEFTRSDQFHHSSPCWFHEGQANAIGIPVFQPTLNDYLNARDGNIQRAINPGTTVSLTDFSAAGITAFLVGQDPLTCSNPSKNQDYQLGYSVGYAATEALIAIGGAQATIALIAKGAEGNTWDQAFQAVYGISWAEGVNYLGQILAAEYAVKPIKKS